MPDECVQCVITSPPYWGLRDYGVDGQIGLEENPEKYISRLVDVFREVRRVLRGDGTLWLNLGDSYWANRSKKWSFVGKTGKPELHMLRSDGISHPFLKPKDLIGIPWRVAFALQADGWYLRSDIVWAKPNAMPESATDRPTRSHEYIFLLSKSREYYYNGEAIKEEAVSGDPNSPRGSVGVLGKTMNSGRRKQDEVGKRQYTGFNDRYKPLEKRNKRDVWTIPTSPYPGAHFATFPPALVEPCIVAGAPEWGVVLDPFNGAGTSGLVATRCGRRYIGIELNPDYVEISKRRIIADAPLINGVDTPHG
ncbi:DNA-methyltransferase [Alicyclobacillus tolerans]|uniref:DNA-methyltransferase n=1 Tax=Alicyclobacillus tolerans TaxID=90970 RepID=UPI003B778A16